MKTTTPLAPTTSNLFENNKNDDDVDDNFQNLRTIELPNQAPIIQKQVDDVSD